MKTRSLRFVPLSLILALVLAAPAFAQSNSWDTPNDVSCTDLGGGTNANVANGRSGVMNLRLKMTGKLSAVNTNASTPVTLDCSPGTPATADGRHIAKLGMEHLCQAAAFAKPDPYTCVGTNFTNPQPLPLPSCADPCCSASVIGDLVQILCTEKDGSFLLSRGINAIKFTANPTAASPKNQSVQGNTTAGNTSGPDLLNQVLVRADPQGNDGILTYTVDDGQPGPAKDFEVDTTGKSDEQLHIDIAAGFKALAFSPPLQAIVRGGNQGAVSSPFPDQYNGFFVFIPNANAGGRVEFLQGSSVSGQNLTIETNNGLSMIPTLNTWGILLLAITLLAGMWFLRRRGRLQHT